jgi:hypothetical protein
MLFSYAEYFSLRSENESRLIKSPDCLCPPLITFEQLGRVSWNLMPFPLRDADLSPSSSTEVENEYELYLLSPQAPLWRVVVQI